MANNAIAKIISREVERQVKEQCQYQRDVQAINEQDMILISLKQMGVLGPKRIKQLDALLRENRLKYALLAIQDDASGDEEIWYTKAKVDRALKEALGEYFLPWDQRYDLRYHSIGLRSVQLIEEHEELKKMVTEAVMEKL